MESLLPAVRKRLQKAPLTKYDYVVLELTGDVQRGVATDGLPQVVAGHAGVDALIRFAPASVHDAEEEERAAG